MFVVCLSLNVRCKLSVVSCKLLCVGLGLCRSLFVDRCSLVAF